MAGVEDHHLPIVHVGGRCPHHRLVTGQGRGDHHQVRGLNRFAGVLCDLVQAGKALAADAGEGQAACILKRFEVPAELWQLIQIHA